MKQEYPPTPENDLEEELVNKEILEENSEVLNDYTVKVDPEKMEDLEDLNREIDFRTSETAEAIRKAQAKKEIGAEYGWNSTKEYSNIIQKPATGLKKWAFGVLAGLGMLGATEKASGANTADSTIKNNKIENFADSMETKSVAKKSYEQNVINEKIGHITVEGSIFVPQKDTTKEVYVYYYSDDGKSKNSLGEILSLMNKKGLVPADGELLEKVYEENKDDVEFNKKTKWIMAPTPENDANDTKATEGVFVTKNNKTQFEIPEHSVFPTKSPNGLGRFEIDQGFDAKEYGLMFYKQVEKNKNADYSSGLAKK